MKKLSLLLGLLSFMLLLGMVGATTYTCSSCSECNDIATNEAEDGDTLQITNTISFSEGDNCINIGFNNGIIDFMGHTLSGNCGEETNCGMAIYSAGNANLTIKNGVFSGNWFPMAIISGGVPVIAQNLLVENCVFNLGNGEYESRGIGISNISQVIIKNNVFRKTSGSGIIEGIYSYDTGNMLVINNTFIDLSAMGFEPKIRYNITFTRNVFYNTNLNNLNRTKDSFFYDNIFNSSSSYLTGEASDSSNMWSITATNGTNIIGGSQIGGNYWAYPNGTGYSEVCSNTDNDSFCDSPYTFNPTDYLPLTLNTPTPETTHYCDSCSDCSAKILSSSSGDTVLLNTSLNDVTDSPCFDGTGMNSNITIDCQGYTIDGDGTPTTGVYVEAESTIQNCIIRDFTDSGIYVYGGDSIKILNNTINVTGGNGGLYFESSNPTSNVYVDRCSVTASLSSSKWAVFARDVVNLTLTNSNFTGNEGIFIDTINNDVTGLKINNSIITGATIAMELNDEDSGYYISDFNIFNNKINGTVKITNSTFIYGSWNTTKATETNIMGGSQIGGNYWAYPNGTGYSQTCLNQNNDSFCDSAYTFNPTDYLPLTLKQAIIPDITWNTPANNSVTQNSSIIYWNVTISDTPDTCLLDLNGTLNITMGKSGNYCSYSFSGANITTYCGRVYANDTFGNMNLSSSRCATINISGTDTTPPNLTIISPVAATYTTSDIALTVSANEPINTWWYNLNGGANTSFTPNTTISGLANGVYTLNLYANDNYGNTGFNSITFTVQVPVISNLGFFAPIAGIAIGGGFLLFILGMFFDEGAALARDPKKLATIAVGIVIVAVLLSALFV
jgi:hypothetical protein